MYKTAEITCHFQLTSYAFMDSLPLPEFHQAFLVVLGLSYELSKVGASLSLLQVALLPVLVNWQIQKEKYYYSEPVLSGHVWAHKKQSLYRGGLLKEVRIFRHD